MSDCFRKIESGGTASTRIYELIELTYSYFVDFGSKVRIILEPYKSIMVHNRKKLVFGLILVLFWAVL